VIQVRGTLKAQAAFNQAVERQQFGRLGQPAHALLTGRGQGQPGRHATARSGAGEAGDVLSQPRPLQQLQGLLLDWRVQLSRHE